MLVARLDNLGKGASGAAVQNIRLMLGLRAPRHETSRRMPELQLGTAVSLAGPGPLYSFEGNRPERRTRCLGRADRLGDR